MSRAATTQLYGLAFMALVVGFGVARRMRPQPVRPNRLILSGVVVTLAIGATLVGAGGAIVGDPITLALLPVFAVAGAALGYYLVRTMRFRADPSTGTLWMRGGAVFALILVGTIVVRLGVRTAVYGSPFGAVAVGGRPNPHGLLYDLSADLLFLSLGLWAARAYFLVQRHRAHAAAARSVPRR